MPTDEQIKTAMRQFFPGMDYRPHQEETIFRIVKAYFDNKKYVVLEAPVGSGKSFVAYTAVKTIQYLSDIKSSPKGPYALAAVKTRSLQRQYEQSLGIPLLWGGTHYDCALFPGDREHHWGSGTCAKKKCPSYRECEYIQSVIEFMKADVAVTNYSYFMNSSNIQPHVCIIDECHNLENSLCDWMSVELSTKYLDRYLGRLLMEQVISASESDLMHRVLMDIIDIDDEKKDWLTDLRDMARDLATEVIKVHRYLEQDMDDIRDEVDDVRQLPVEDRQKLTQYNRYSTYFKNLGQKLMLLANLKTDWVIASCSEEATEKETKSYPKIVIKPLSIAEISQGKFFNRSPFFLMMSATICGFEMFMEYLGLSPDPENCEYIQVPSTFPVENRPVVAIRDIDKFSHSKREWQLPKFTEYMDLIIDAQFEGVRGIVHSASYDNAEFIRENSRHSERMRFPNSDDLTEIVPLLQEREDTIVVSPSVVEGLDLKGDLCRFSMFFKVPWASLGDKWVKTRSGLDNDWYCRDAVIKLVQGSGRGTRSSEDSSVTVVLDGHFLRLFYRYDHIFPDWFLEAVDVVAVT